MPNYQQELPFDNHYRLGSSQLLHATWRNSLVKRASLLEGQQVIVRGTRQTRKSRNWYIQTKLQKVPWRSFWMPKDAPNVQTLQKDEQGRKFTPQNEMGGNIVERCIGQDWRFQIPVPLCVPTERTLHYLWNQLCGKNHQKHLIETTNISNIFGGLDVPKIPEPMRFPVILYQQVQEKNAAADARNTICKDVERLHWHPKTSKTAVIVLILMKRHPKMIEDYKIISSLDTDNKKPVDPFSFMPTHAKKSGREPTWILPWKVYCGLHVDLILLHCIHGPK